MMSPEGTKRVVESLLKDSSDDAVHAIITISRHLAAHPLSEFTEYLYKKILERNISEAADLLLGQSSPLRFFDSLPANQENISWAINLFQSNKASDMYVPIILSALGILERGYKHVNEAVALYKTTTEDVYTISKYLLKKDKRTEEVILKIIEGFASLYSPREVALSAGTILEAWIKSPEELIKILPKNSSPH